MKKIKELDNFELPEKTFEERKNDLMNWFYIALRMCLRFLKMYLNERSLQFCHKSVLSLHFCLINLPVSAVFFYF